MSDLLNQFILVSKMRFRFTFTFGFGFGSSSILPWHLAGRGDIVLLFF